MHSKLTVLSGEDYFPSSSPSPMMQKLEPTNPILSLRNNFIQAMQQRNQSQNPIMVAHSQETVKTAGEMHQQELQLLYSIPAVSPSMRPQNQITSGRRMDGSQVSVTVNSSTRNIPAQAARFPLLVESSRGYESEQSQFSNRKAFQQNGAHDSGQDHTRPVTARSSKSQTTVGLKFFSSVKKLKLEQEKGKLQLENQFQLNNNNNQDSYGNHILIKNKNQEEDSEDKDHLMKAVCTPKASGNLIALGSSGKKSEKRRNKTSSKKGIKSSVPSKKTNKSHKNGDNYVAQTTQEGVEQKKDEKEQGQQDAEDIESQQEHLQQIDNQIVQQQEQKKMPSKKSHRKSQSQSSMSMQRLVKEIESKKGKHKNSSNCLQIFTKISSPNKKSSNLQSPVNHQSVQKQLQINNPSQNTQSLAVSTMNSPKQQYQSTSTTTTIAMGQSNINHNHEEVSLNREQSQEGQMQQQQLNYNGNDNTNIKSNLEDLDVKQEKQGTGQLLHSGKVSKHRQTNSLTSNPLSSKYCTQNVSPISSFVFQDSNQTSFVQKQKSSDIGQFGQGNNTKNAKDLIDKKRQEDIQKQQSLLLRANLKGKNEQIRKKNLSTSKLAKNSYKVAETSTKQKFIPWGIDQQKLQKYFLKGAVGSRGSQVCDNTEEINGTSNKKPDTKQRRIQLGLDCLNQLNESKIESLIQNQRKKGICSTHHESHADESKQQQQHSMQLKYSQQQDQPLPSATHKKEITLEQKKIIQQFMASKKRQGEEEEEKRKKEQLLRQERLKLNLQLLNEEIKGSLQLSSKHARCSSSNNNNNTLQSPANNGQPNNINLHLSEKQNIKDKDNQVRESSHNNEKLHPQQQSAQLSSQSTVNVMKQHQQYNQQKDHHPLLNYKLPQQQTKTATTSAVGSIVNSNSQYHENDLKDQRSGQASGIDFASSSSFHPAQSNQSQSNVLQPSNSSSTQPKKRKIKSQKQTKSLSTISASNLLPAGLFISPVTPSEVSSRIGNNKYFFNAQTQLSPQNEDQVCDYINDEYKKYFNWRDAFSDSNLTAQLKVQLPGQNSTSSSKKRSKILKSHNSVNQQQQQSLKLGLLDQENADKFQKYQQNDYVINQDQYECFEQLSNEQGNQNYQQVDFSKTTSNLIDQNGQFDEKKTAEEMNKEFEERKNLAYQRFGKLAQRLQNSVFVQMKQSQLQNQQQLQGQQQEQQMQQTQKIQSPFILTQSLEKQVPKIDNVKEDNQIKQDTEGTVQRVNNNVIQSVISDTNALELYHNTEEDEIEENRQKLQNDSNNINPKIEQQQKQDEGLFQDQVMPIQGLYQVDKQKDTPQSNQDSVSSYNQSHNGMRGNNNELQIKKDESRDNLTAVNNNNNVTKSVEDIMEGSSQRFKERSLPENNKNILKQKIIKESNQDVKSEHKQLVIVKENQKDKEESNQINQQLLEQQQLQIERDVKLKQNIMDIQKEDKLQKQIEQQKQSDQEIAHAAIDKINVIVPQNDNHMMVDEHLSNEGFKDTFKTEDFQHERKQERGGEPEDDQEDYNEEDEDQSLLRMRQINEQFYSRPHSDDIGGEKQSLSQQLPTVHSDFNISGENKENEEEIHELNEEEREGMILLNLAAIYIQKIWRGYLTRKIISQFYNQLEEEYYRSQEQQQEEYLLENDGTEIEKDPICEDEDENDERIDPNDLLQQSPSIDGIGQQKKSVQHIEQKYQKILESDELIKETDQDDKKIREYSTEKQENQDQPIKQSEIEAIQLAEKCMRSCEEMRQEQLSKWTQLIEQLQEFKSNGLLPPQQKEFLDNLCEQYEANKKELLNQGGVSGEVKLNQGTEEDKQEVDKMAGMGLKQEQKIKEKTPSKQEALKEEELEVGQQNLSNIKKSINNTNSTPKKINSSSKKEDQEKQLNSSPPSDTVRQSKGSLGEQSQQQLGSLSKSALSDADNASSICSSRNEGREMVDLEKFQLSSLKKESMEELFKMREEVISFQKEAKIDIIRQMLEDKRVTQQTYEEKKKDIEAWVVREREKVRRTHHEIERGWRKFAETVRQTKRGLHFMKQVKSQQHSQNNNMPKYHSAKRSLSTVELDKRFSKLLSFSDLKDGDLNKGQSSANNQNSFRSFGSGTPTNLKLIHVQRASTKHLPNKQYQDAHSHRNLTYAAPSSKSCMSWDGHVLLTNNSEEGEFEDINDYLLKMKSLASRNFQTLKDNQMMLDIQSQQQQQQQQQIQSLNDMGPISSILIGQEVLPKVVTKDITIEDNELDNPSLKSFIIEANNNNNSITKLDPTLNSIMIQLSNKDDKIINTNSIQNTKGDMPLSSSSPPHSPDNISKNKQQQPEQKSNIIPAFSKEIKGEDTIKQSQNLSEEPKSNDGKSDLSVSQTVYFKSAGNTNNQDGNDNLQADRLEIKEFQASDDNLDQYFNSKSPSEQNKIKDDKLGSPKSKVDQLAYYQAKELGKLKDNQESEVNSGVKEGDELKELENNADQLRIKDIQDNWMEADAQNEMMMIKNIEEIITPIESCQNLNSIKDFLVALAEFIKENFRDEFLTRINQPLGIDPLEFLKTFNITENTEPQDTDTSNGPIYPIVKYIHIQKPVVSEEIFLTFNELYQVENITMSNISLMLRRQKKIEAQAAGLEKDIFDEINDDDEDEEDIDIFNSQSDIEKYNLKLVFDCFNESLDFIRPFSLSGKPLPWKLNQKKLAIVNVQDEDVEKVLGMAIGRMLKWGSCLCGFISEKIEFPLGQEEENKEYLNQIKEDRLAQMLENEVVENEQKWLIYEDEETDVQLEIADDIFHYLMSETAQWIYLKMQDKLDMMDSLEIAFGKNPAINGQEIDENDGQEQLLDYSSALDVQQKHREMENISQTALDMLQHHNSIAAKCVPAGDVNDKLDGNNNNNNNHNKDNKELEQKDQEEQMVLQEGQNQEKQIQTSSVEKRRKAQMVEINSKQNEHFVRPIETPTFPISMKHSF